MSKLQEIFTGVEFGSDVIRVVVATFENRQDASSRLIVRGFAEISSGRLLLKDEPQNPKLVSERFLEVFDRAWESSGLPQSLRPGVLCISVSGTYLHFPLFSLKKELDPSQPVTEEDMVQLLKELSRDSVNRKSLSSSTDLEDLSISDVFFANRFFLSNDRLCFYPVGQCTTSLTAESYAVAYENYRMQSLLDTLAQSHFPHGVSQQFVAAPIAAAAALFRPATSSDPQGLVINFGSGMTSLAMPTRIGFVLLAQIPVGLDNLANDLSIAFNLQFETAQVMLRDLAHLGCSVLETPDGRARLFNVHDYGSKNRPDRVLSSATVEAVISCRLRELFRLIKEHLEEQKVYQWIGSEVLLCGDGAGLPLLPELAKRVLGRKVRLELPYDVSGHPDFHLSAAHAVVLGAIRFGCHSLLLGEDNERKEAQGLFGPMIRLVKSFLEW